MRTAHWLLLRSYSKETKFKQSPNYTASAGGHRVVHPEEDCSASGQNRGHCRSGHRCSDSFHCGLSGWRGAILRPYSTGKEAQAPSNKILVFMN